MKKESNILLAFYGDDFTGSTDALECLCINGVNAVLFMEPPTVETLQLYPELNAYGIAGHSRALSPQEMEPVLTHAFGQMKTTHPRHIHYKVCSTFDSAPHTGSIGKAIDVGSRIFNTKLVPMPGGNPALGRYCAFGNLFARMGIGSNGSIYRIDRHPSMSKHPVTPAHESDLRLHIGAQTQQKIGLIDIAAMEQSIETWQLQLKADETIALVDATHMEQVPKIGAWLDSLPSATGTIFSVGSSIVENALSLHWVNQGKLHPKASWPSCGKAEPLLVISGSCSPVTAAQIQWAKANGFGEVLLDITAINDNGDVSDKTMQVIEQLNAGKNTIVHAGAKKSGELLPSKILGSILGTIAKNAIQTTKIKRLVVAGGDTSSYAARALEIDAVEMVAPIVTGAPLCRAYSKNINIQGLEISFKGGQVGVKNFFGRLSAGQ